MSWTIRAHDGNVGLGSSKDANIRWSSAIPLWPKVVDILGNVVEFGYMPWGSVDDNHTIVVSHPNSRRSTLIYSKPVGIKELDVSLRTKPAPMIMPMDSIIESLIPPTSRDLATYNEDSSPKSGMSWSATSTSGTQTGSTGSNGIVTITQYLTEDMTLTIGDIVVGPITVDEYVTMNTELNPS